MPSNTTQLKYRTEHPDRIKASKKKYYENNKDKFNKQACEWRKNNPEKLSVIHRKAALKADYNITPEQYNQMLNEQHSVCAICGKPETSINPRNNMPRCLAVDHDHNTGKIRGLLCSRCNTALGLLNENKETVSKLVLYLEKFVNE